MKISQNFKKCFGFSLIEMVIYIGLLSALLVVLTNVFLSTIDTKLESETISSVEQDGRFILSRFIYDTSRAQNIVLPATPGDVNTSLQLTIDSVNYSYSVSGGNLIINVNNVSDPLNGFDTTISNLSFKRLGNTGGKNSVQISFTVRSVTQKTSGSESKNYQITVALR